MSNINVSKKISDTTYDDLLGFCFDFMIGCTVGYIGGWALFFAAIGVNALYNWVF